MKSIIIIGAGIAGLSAGVYARRNGYDTTIFELHDKPGGLCTAWKRKGYAFDGCLHWLVGSSPRHSYYRMWKELGALPATRIIDPEIFQTFKDTAGRTFNVYTNADKLKAEMLSLSPADAIEINALCSAVKRFSCFTRTAGKNPFRFVANMTGIMRGMPLFKKYGPLSMAEYAAKFTDPLIRSAFENILMYSDFPSISLFFTLAGMHIRASGFPEGGSLAFARTIEKTFLDLGGKIEYKKPVNKIVVENDRAVGIELCDGSARRADFVISAADGHATLFDMLGDGYTTQKQREKYAAQEVFPPTIQVSLGINRDMSDLPDSCNAQVKDPFVIAGKTHDALWYRNFSFDGTMALAGKTALTVLFTTDLAWWEKIGYKTSAYEAEKKKILETTTTELEKILPGISSQIETSDVATPFTTLRYTNNWKASMMGFRMTKATMGRMYEKAEYTLPGLEGFFMIGQWVKSFGVPTAAMTAKEVMREICNADGKKFRAG